MKKLALLYWPKGGSVEYSAGIIKNKIQNFDVDFKCIEDFIAGDLVGYDAYIFGGSTVGADHWSNDDTDNAWAGFFADLEASNVDLKGKKGAIFGLGNQVLYPEQFVDGMMYIKKKLEAAGLEIIGETSTDGYDYTESKAEVEGKFVGLALDEDSQSEFTDSRIEGWLSVISEEL